MAEVGAAARRRGGTHAPRARIGSDDPLAGALARTLEASQKVVLDRIELLRLDARDAVTWGVQRATQLRGELTGRQADDEGQTAAGTAAPTKT